MPAAMLTKRKSLDFDDALQYYVAKRLGVEAIVSYDRHFDKLDVPRTEPSRLIKKTHKAEGEHNAERENPSN